MKRKYLYVLILVMFFCMIFNCIGYKVFATDVDSIFERNNIC